MNVHIIATIFWEQYNIQGVCDDQLSCSHYPSLKIESELCYKDGKFSTLVDKCRVVQEVEGYFSYALASCIYMIEQYDSDQRSPKRGKLMANQDRSEFLNRGFSIKDRVSQNTWIFYCILCQYYMVWFSKNLYNILIKFQIYVTNF